MGNLRNYISSIAGTPNDVALDSEPNTQAKTYTYSGTANLDTFFGAVKFIGAYRRVSTSAALDLDGSPFAIQQTTGRQKLQQYSGELQITGKAFANAVDFAGGLFYFNESGVDGSVGQTIPTLNPLTNVFNGTIFNDSMGIYGQANWHLTDKLTFTGGLRYSIDDKGLTTRNQTLNRNTLARACQVATSSLLNDCALTRHNQFAGVSYLAGLDYKIDDDVLVYVKTSKGFRSGGQNLRATTEASALPFRPEIALAQEVGLKSELFDRRIRLNLAGYYSTVKDIQRSTLVGFADGTTSTILSNAGKLRVWGLEGELTAELLTGFRIGATAALTRAKYLEYSEVPNRTDLNGDRRDERIEGVPRQTFSLTTTYQRDIGIGALLLRGDYSWTDAFALQPYSSFLGDPQGVTIDPATGRTVAQEIIKATTSPKQGILSGRVSLTVLDGALEIAIFGRNLTNDRSPVTALYVPGINYVSGQLREPRTFGISGTFRFGQ
ncbi:TonB-dependent receptor (plasmid) [Sphingomonas paeninsulae]|uniref:TonB-dependent receptor n=1 Tax=Sphingomonas paeninsulae TaxID=2319844 RepID=A0A494T6P5_SPHPE|nr:TonB-dependent receptor [Sphingomonas paeninsulae]